VLDAVHPIGDQQGALIIGNAAFSSLSSSKRLSFPLFDTNHNLQARHLPLDEMSSPSQELHEVPGLPPNPYAAPDDVVVQQWQRNAEAVRAGLTLPGHPTLSTSSHEMEPQFSPQGTYPCEVDMTRVRLQSWPSLTPSTRLTAQLQAENSSTSESSEDITELVNLQEAYPDRFSRLAAQARAENARTLQQIRMGIAVDMRDWDQDEDDHLPTDIMDDAALDASGQPESLPRGSADGQTKLSPSLSSILEAAEQHFSSRSGCLETKLLEPSQAPHPNMQFSDFDFDDMAFQHILPTTEQCEMQPNINEGQAQSAALSKALSQAKSKRTASPMDPMFLDAMESSHSDSDRAEFSLDTAGESQHNFFADAPNLEFAALAPPSAPSSPCEPFESHLLIFLDGQEIVTADQLQPSQPDDQPREKYIRRVSEIVVEICKLPTEQREEETKRLLTCLGLDQPQQDSAFGIFKRMVERNEETKNYAPPVVFRKWLCILVHDAQIRASTTSSTASSTSRNIKNKGLFCNDGIHKLKCGHECRSNQECGINCVIYSTYPDTPFIDVRLSELSCDECANWL
jgi:hypothetical protein